MSIPVPADLAELRRAVADHGTGVGYLLTTAGDGRVKAVTVEPRFDPVVDGAAEDQVVLVRGPGRGSLRNVAAHDAVTLLFPPRDHHGYTLLVDGTAAPAGDQDLVVHPTSAVLHRPADHADGPRADAADRGAGGGCGHDCAPVG